MDKVTTAPRNSDLSDHLLAFMPDALLEGRLLRIYHRNLASRLWEHFTSPDSHDRRYFETTPTIWLHPRGVWAAQSLPLHEELFDRVREHAHGHLLDSTSPAPELEFITESKGDAWCSTACRYLQEYDEALGRTYVLEMAGGPACRYAERVAAACAVVGEFWPAVLAEFNTIVRTLVFVQGGGFIYASFQNMLGSIFVAVNSMASTASIVEMILHEGGHQSHFVHESFSQFLRNPEAMASHPLRSDPRPIRGCVHALHVLARMAIGFTLWCEHGTAPPEIRVRRDEVVADLKRTIEVVDEKADWTPAGVEYFGRLLAATASVR